MTPVYLILVRNVDLKNGEYAVPLFCIALLDKTLVLLVTTDCRKDHYARGAHFVLIQNVPKNCRLNGSGPESKLVSEMLTSHNIRENIYCVEDSWLDFISSGLQLVRTYDSGDLNVLQMASMTNLFVSQHH